MRHFADYTWLVSPFRILDPDAQGSYSEPCPRRGAHCLPGLWFPNLIFLKRVSNKKKRVRVNESQWHMKIVIEKGTWGGDIRTNLAQFLPETSQKLKISLSLPEISWTFFLKNFREKFFVKKYQSWFFEKKSRYFTKIWKCRYFGFGDFPKKKIRTFFVLIEKYRKNKNFKIKIYFLFIFNIKHVRVKFAAPNSQ